MPDNFSGINILMFPKIQSKWLIVLFIESPIWYQAEQQNKLTGHKNIDNWLKFNIITNDRLIKIRDLS